uniref:Golgi apparatus membrane protein TVP23 n=1 Tax=Physcomitrium patens TaxID=3218 RepID=A0A7I4DLM1_PHYPA
MGPPIMERQTPMLPQNTAAENNDVRYMHPAAAFFHCAGKNVTGRLLVGLRWWNDVDERGESTWKFESLNQQALDRINRNDSWIFWWSLYINNAAWVALAIIAIVKLNFDYLIITIIAISLTSANTAGYSKCRKDAERRANAGGQGFASSLFQAARGVRNMV